MLPHIFEKSVQDSIDAYAKSIEASVAALLELNSLRLFGKKSEDGANGSRFKGKRKAQGEDKSHELLGYSPPSTLADCESLASKILAEQKLTLKVSWIAADNFSRLKKLRSSWSY